MTTPPVRDHQAIMYILLGSCIIIRSAEWVSHRRQLLWFILSRHVRSGENKKEFGFPLTTLFLLLLLRVFVHPCTTTTTFFIWQSNRKTIFVNPSTAALPLIAAALIISQPQWATHSLYGMARPPPVARPSKNSRIDFFYSDNEILDWTQLHERKGFESPWWIHIAVYVHFFTCGFRVECKNIGLPDVPYGILLPYAKMACATIFC